MKNLLRTSDTPVYYGWWVVTAALLCMIFVFGVPTTVLPVLYPALKEQFGWSREQLTLIATMKFISGTIWGLFFASVAQRVINVRWVILASGVLTGICMISFLWIESLREFYVIGFLLGVGALGVMISVKVLVSNWFTKRQGFAVGIALLGTSVAGTFAPPLASWGIETVGWRGTMAWMSAGIWLIALPFFAWKAKDSPRDVSEDVHAARFPKGFHPNGDKKPAVDASPSTFDVVLRSRSFWLLAASVFMIGFVDQAWDQHYVLYIKNDLGFSLKSASTAFGLTFFISIAGKIGFGWVYDKTSVRGVMFCYILMAVSVILAMPIEGAFLLLVFSVTRGVAHGGAIVDVPILAKHCFGPKVLSRTIGLLTACVTLGFAAGPPVVGHLRDTQGSYTSAFILLIALSILATACLFGVRPTYWESLRHPERFLESTPAPDAPPQSSPALLE